jgi:N-dimethylarginine dimethylaminohydrolase
VTRPERTDRRRETQGIDSLLKRCARLVRLEVGSIEGGDVIVLPQWILVGIGEKTDKAAADELRDEIAARGIGRQVVPLHLAMSRMVHLDCVFNPVSPEVALVYPPALTEEAYGWLRRRFDLIEATLDETTALQINTINLTPRTVVLTRGSDRLAEQLGRRGYEIVTVAYDEVGKGYGAFRCTTLPLRRE